MELSDNELLQQIRSDNEHAFGALFSRHRDSVYRYAWYMLRNHEQAQDITQEVFFSLWKRREKVTTTGNSILPYLVTLTRNDCLDAIEATDKLREKQKSYAQHKESYTLNDHIEKEELGSRLTSAINSIAHPACKQIFEKSYLEGKKAAEIAEELNITTGTVKNQVHRALKFLREKLDPTL